MTQNITIKYSYKGVPTLRRFSESDAFLRLALGPFGSGKSSACAVETVARGLAQQPGPDGIRRSRWIIVRNTYRQLNDSTIKTFFQWFPPHHFGDYKQSDQSYIIKAFEGTEIEVIFRALDRPDHVGNLLSLEVTGGWVNEAREVPWSIIDALQGRVGRYPARRDGGATWWGVFMDSNPADTDSKMYKYFCETKRTKEEEDAVQLFKQPSGLSGQAENLDNLPGGREYYKRMAVGKDPEFIKVYIHGDWGFVSDGRQVFPEYVDSVHCAPCKPVSYEPIYRGWDFGLTPACVFLQLTSTGQVIVFDELFSETVMGIDQFADEVIEHTSQNYVDMEIYDIGDPAGEQRAQTDARTAYQILHSKGVLIEAGMQSLTVRLESVRRPLTRLVVGKPGFQLDPKCKMLRKGFLGGYCFRRLQTSAEKFTAVPDKNKYSHCMDAMEYPMTRLFGGGLTTPKFYEAPSEGFEEEYRSDITGY